MINLIQNEKLFLGKLLWILIPKIKACYICPTDIKSTDTPHVFIIDAALPENWHWKPKHTRHCFKLNSGRRISANVAAHKL